VTQTAAALLHEAGRLQRLGQRAAAIEAFRAALALDPTPAERWYEFGYLLKSDGRYPEALDAFGEALARGIARAEEVHLNRSVLFADHLRRDEDAQRELEAALAIAPDYVPAHFNLGNLHALAGRRAQALACYRDVNRLAAETGHPLFELGLEALSRIAVLDPPADLQDPLLRQLEDAAAGLAQDRRVRANLLFALGRTLDRLGAYDRAFDAFARANRSLLRQGGRRYDRTHAERLTQAFIDAFPSAFDAMPGDGNETGATPLFVCGMFRSGSTLIEQVLGAHQRVVAGGELDFLMRLAAERLAPFPASIAHLDAAAFAGFAREYRDLLARLFPQAGPGMFVTDKRPDNFQLIGLIKRMFPRAKFVHTTRHPLDTGVSVFVQHLVPQVASYACDLGDIGHYYGQYRRLMAHWKALYPDDIVDVHYDDLVREPVPTLQRLFATLGLDWDERCLEFHRSENAVKTASYLQVRQPLYRASSGRWRNYETHLRPLREALLAAGIGAEELA
jgi:tetratricopeptide (TPR) repeat protein